MGACWQPKEAAKGGHLNSGLSKLGSGALPVSAVVPLAFRRSDITVSLPHWNDETLREGATRAGRRATRRSARRPSWGRAACAGLTQTCWAGQAVVKQPQTESITAGKDIRNVCLGRGQEKAVLRGSSWRSVLNWTKSGRFTERGMCPQSNVLCRTLLSDLQVMADGLEGDHGGCCP